MQYNLLSNVGRFLDHHGDLLDNLQLVLYSQTRNCVQYQICTIGVGKSGCHGGRMTPATHVSDELTFCEVQCHGAHVFRISRANQLWSRRSRSWSKNLKGKDLVYLVALLMQMSTTKLDKMQRTIYTKINICIYFSLVSCSFHSGIFFTPVLTPIECVRTEPTMTCCVQNSNLSVEFLQFLFYVHRSS